MSEYILHTLMKTNIKTILLIEPDPEVAEVMEMLLENEGYAVAWLRTANILNSFIHEKYALIMLDHWICGDRDLGREIRSSVNFAQTPILMLSTEPDLKLVAESNLADGYLRKPFKINDLLKAVQEYIK